MVPCWGVVSQIKNWEKECQSLVFSHFFFSVHDAHHNTHDIIMAHSALDNYFADLESKTRSDHLSHVNDNARVSAPFVPRRKSSTASSSLRSVSRWAASAGCSSLSSDHLALLVMDRNHDKKSSSLRRPSCWASFGEECSPSKQFSISVPTRVQSPVQQQPPTHEDTKRGIVWRNILAEVRFVHLS
jgi:hypothetical protein